MLPTIHLDIFRPPVPSLQKKIILKTANTVSILFFIYVKHTWEESIDRQEGMNLDDGQKFIIKSFIAPTLQVIQPGLTDL